MNIEMIGGVTNEFAIYADVGCHYLRHRIENQLVEYQITLAPDKYIFFNVVYTTEDVVYNGLLFEISNKIFNTFALDDFEEAVDKLLIIDKTVPTEEILNNVLHFTLL